MVWETLPLLAIGDTLALAKLSPLAWGTLKAALAALLFAIPVALGRRSTLLCLCQRACVRVSSPR
ncbi:hypothetical protein HSBAA_65760 [Vreelandella sulfidaeris]|uniref:Uncharacterized protein n=1 Tax=Vreelandella sulfidaeris TaxID=115553 RepID=A0A455UGB4_9GAMM|nr:hypothetical protein HSBAA_65760 [Halomonas sulfidaeris]